jgi:uncharacterized ferritin-like protein (DUF455 family)
MGATVELRAFAERVLYGTHLHDDKLADPGPLTDEEPGPAAPLPRRPARPATLRLAGRPAGDRVRLSTARDLASDRSRGLLLHDFLNHELIALELMALALLRFRDAPRPFRLSLGATMRDEQRHATLYADRMQALGVQVGDGHAGPGMWTAVAHARTAFDFVSRMAVTFEQANLDFALYYREVFTQAGDLETAAVLDTIYEDEVRHLRSGLRWFRALKDPEKDDWSAFLEQQDCVSLTRARGPVFDRAGREAAGLDAAFIDQVEVYQRSPGHRPRVWWFHPTCEDAVGAEQTAATPKSPRPTPKAAIRAFADDLSALPIALASPHDVVLVAHPPSTAFLSSLREAGLRVPELVVRGESLAGHALAKRPLAGLSPWGWSPEAARVLAPLVGAVSSRAQDRPLWEPRRAETFAKTALPTLRARVRLALPKADRMWLTPEAADGTTALDEAAVDAAIATLQQRHGWTTVVLKAPFSTSGRHRRRISGALETADRRWLSAALARQPGRGVVVEPWLEKVGDLSLHGDVDDRGVVQTRGWSRFFTSPGGRWDGTALGALRDQLTPELARFLYGGGRDTGRLGRVSRAVGGTVGPWLAERRHRGPVGFDMMLVRVGGELCLHPLVEVNPRWTMGRVGLALSKRVAPRARGSLRLLTDKTLPTEATLADGAKAWAADAPLTKNRAGLWTGGRLLLTEARPGTTVVAAVDLRPVAPES